MCILMLENNMVYNINNEKDSVKALAFFCSLGKLGIIW